MENSEDKAENEREEVIHEKKKDLAEVILKLKHAHHGVFCPSPCGDTELC